MTKSIFSREATRHVRPAQIPPASNGVSPELLMIGNTSETWRIGNIVRKLHYAVSDQDITDANIAAARDEANVYLILGNHPLIAKCHVVSPTKSYIDLEYYPHGTLRDYASSHQSDISVRQLEEWARQLIESVAYIHSKGVRHADLRLEQWLLDDQLQPHLADFNGSGFDANPDLGLEPTAATSLECTSHCLPRDFDQDSTVKSDLFALGSTLYELVTNSRPFEGQEEDVVEANFTNTVFPSIKNVFLGDIIMGCWQGAYQSADQILEDLPPL